MIPNSALVFAAGFGTRMGELTKLKPKPLLNVGGKTLLDRTLDDIRSAGVEHVVINTHYLGDQIAAHVSGQGVHISREHPEILDTGGGLKAALPMLDASPVFTSNSDAVFSGPNPFDLLAKAWKAEAEAVLLVVPIERAVGRLGAGDFDVRTTGHLARGSAFVYTGVQIIRTDRIAQSDLNIFSLNAIWDEIAKAGRLFGAPYPGLWCDVGHPEGIALAESVLETRDV